MRHQFALGPENAAEVLSNVSASFRLEPYISGRNSVPLIASSQSGRLTATTSPFEAIRLGPNATERPSESFRGSLRAYTTKTGRGSDGHGCAVLAALPEDHCEAALALANACLRIRLRSRGEVRFGLLSTGNRGLCILAGGEI